MKFYLLLSIVIVLTVSVDAQSTNIEEDQKNKILAGLNIGLGWSYMDKAFLVNFPVSFNIDYRLSKQYFLQVAPKYTWLKKWNEHYFTLPIHLRKQFGEKFSVFAGPSITFDIGYFKDMGLSAGFYYNFNKRSSLILSAYTFTLYDYNIDYLFIPVGLTYNYMIFN